MNTDKCSDPGGEGVGGAGREGIEGINCDGNNKIKNKTKLSMVCTCT